MTEPHTVEVTQTNSRFHFTNESPVSVETAEGRMEIGAGWLAITEAEYHLLASIPPLPATEMVEAVAEAMCRSDLPGWADEKRERYFQQHFDDYCRLARAAIPIVIAAERERRINCDALSINKGRTVTIDFTNRDDAFALFNELKDRSLPLAPEG